MDSNCCWVRDNKGKEMLLVFFFLTHMLCVKRYIYMYIWQFARERVTLYYDHSLLWLESLVSTPQLVCVFLVTALFSTSFGTLMLFFYFSFLCPWMHIILTSSTLPLNQLTSFRILWVQLPCVPDHPLLSLTLSLSTVSMWTWELFIWIHDET